MSDARVGASPQQIAGLAHVLREYALLADGERGALVGPRGEISWMCFPGWADSGLFSTLMGGPGMYAVTPVARFVWGGYYEPSTLIWRSRWTTEDGIVECREALARPADPRRAVMLRQVLGRDGRHRVRVLLEPRHEFGTARFTRVTAHGDATWTGRSGGVHVRFTGPAGAAVEEAGREKRLSLTLDVRPGSVQDLVLELSLEPPEDDCPSAEHLWRQTEATWKAVVEPMTGTAAPRDAAHAYAVLSGLTTSGGGTVAAATASLPERADAGRSYDYRYVWCRDQSYIGQAAAAAGAHELLDASVTFLRERLLSDGPELKPAYTSSGGRVPDERHLGLPGYPGGADVVGNHVNSQFQLDAFGEALLLFAAADRSGRLDEPGWRAATQAVDGIERRWQEPDAGVWELSPKRWTHSRLACVAGLRAISKCQPGAATAARWMTLADRIESETAAQSTHSSGRWQRAPDDERVDGALLVAAIRGAIPADDPRTLATLTAVEQDLTDDGYAYRYRPDGRPLGDAEGAFLLCGFWMALAKQQQGDSLAAMRWFDRNRTACGPPGLLSEEFDVRQRQLRGNLPQAFVHALLLEAAAVLGRGS